MAHPDNRFYGHHRVLADYAGTGTDRRRIFGHLQHGWSATTGLPHRSRVVSWLPKLVWSRANERAARDAGLGRVTAIGAPFAYLCATADRHRGEAVQERPSSTIFYVAHGTERGDVQGSHERLAAEIREREVGDVTVCLYWWEHDQEAVRRVYERAGFGVVCHGRREAPAFLVDQRQELLRHGRVAGNEIGTALWYGALLGRPVEVYGTTFSRHERPSVWQLDGRVRERWPSLYDGGLSAGDATLAAREELGADLLLDPASLRVVLGWDRSTPTRDALLHAATLADHHVRRAAVHARRVARRPQR